jgi:polysaccharide export outer membrane protein
MFLFWGLVCLLGLPTLAEAQTLKPGDTVEISVLQDSKLDRRVIVDPSGQIAFPMAGHVLAAGQTPLGLEKLIKARLQPNYKDDNIDVSVSLAAIGRPDIPEEDLKPKVFITGEILRPGSYVVRKKTNLMQAIALAGGFGPFAAKQRIQVRRRRDGVDTLYSFDYRAFESGRDMEGNIDLRSGDIVIVPERGLFE